MIEEREIEYIKISEKQYNLLGNGFFIGEILILDKVDIVFNPANEDKLDFTINELKVIISIIKKIEQEKLH